MGSHKPIRECILCRKKINKEDLLRIVKNADGILIDTTHKMQGRGAYICNNCRHDPNLIKRRPLDRAFRQTVSEEIYKELILTEN